MWIDTPIGKAHIPLDLSWSYLPKIPDTEFPTFFELKVQLEAFVAAEASAPIFADLLMQREAATASPQKAGKQFSDAAYATSPFIPFHVFDSFESLNYALAAQFALSRKNTHPFSLIHLCAIHKRLLPAHPAVGRLRRGHIWIGPRGAGVDEAKIILPPANIVRPAMAALRQFYDRVLEPCRLQSVALMHLQFLSIHPFYDGNGRIARILTAVLLSRLDIMRVGSLMISSELYETNLLYRKCLEAAEQKSKIEEWVHFMVDVCTRQGSSPDCYPAGAPELTAMGPPPIVIPRALQN